MAGALLSSRASPSMRLSRRGPPPGVLAGSIIGGLVGVALIFVCLLPFILRAHRKRKRRGTQHYDDPFEAEMGQEDLGGPPSRPLSLRPHHDAQSSRNFIGTGSFKSSPRGSVVLDAQATAMKECGVGLQPPGQFYPGASTDTLGQIRQQSLHQYPSVVNFRDGLPSPISPSLTGAEFTPTSASARTVSVPGPFRPGQDARGSVVSAQSPASTRVGTQGTWHKGSRDSKGSTRNLSLRTSRDLTGITPGGITEEPDEIEPGQHHHHRIHLPEAVQRIIHPHRRLPSEDRRQPSEASSAGCQAQEFRSPTLDTNDTLVHTDSAPTFYPETDTEARGEAWSYYHPEQDEISVPAPSTSTGPAHLRIVPPPTQPSGVEPISPVSPDFGRGDGPEVGIGRPLVDEPEAISPASENATPKEGKRFPFRTPSFLKRQRQNIERMDSIGPQPFMSDISSPPARKPTGPSVKPSDVMKPTTDTEHHFQVTQDIYMMENSPPPPPMMESTPPAEPSSSPQPVTSPQPDEAQSPEQYIASSPIPPKIEYQTPSNPGMSPEPALDSSSFTMNVTDIDMGRSPNSVALSTPPPTEPSIGNTPSTGITELDPSYIPDEQYQHKYEGARVFAPGWEDMQQGPAYNLDLYVRNQQLEDGVNVQPTQPPSGFQCEECGRSFDQVHKLNHHKRYHERPHQCTFPNCEMRFGTKTHLDRHINDKHMRAKKYYCMVRECPFSRQGGKSFPRKDNWKRHMIKQHSITPDADPGGDLVDEIMGGT